MEFNDDPEHTAGDNAICSDDFYTPDPPMDAAKNMSSMPEDVDLIDDGLNQAPAPMPDDFYHPPSRTDSSGDDEELAEPDVHAGPQAQADIERVLDLYHAYKTGHVVLGLTRLQFHEFRQFAERLEADPAFDELYREYLHDREAQHHRHMNETIIDEHGHVGPRWAVQDRDWREWRQGQLGTLTSVGPVGLLGMMITYARTGDVDRAIEVADRLAPQDGVARGIARSVGGAPHIGASADPSGRPAHIGRPPERATPEPPDDLSKP